MSAGIDGGNALPGARRVQGTTAIRGIGRELIHTLDDWFRLAPPAGRAVHWKEGRSALELARRWVGGGVPEEVRLLLDSNAAFRGFSPVQALAETRTAIDDYRGNTRNHDLLVIGETAAGPAVLDVEGKVDESFGHTIAEQLTAARAARVRNPRSMASDRLEELCSAVLGTPPTAVAVGHLRYQLVYGVAAAVIAAAKHGASRVAWIVHEFRTPAAKPAALGRNARDLDAFLRHLGSLDTSDGTARQATQTSLAGPFRLPGGRTVPADIDLYVGKAIHTL